MDSLYGLMVDVIKGYGRMVSKMVEVYIVIKKVLRGLDYGRMVRR